MEATMRGLATAIVIAGLGWASQARAQTCPASPPDCSTLLNPVYILTADTQESLLKGLGKRLRQPGGPHRQMTLVYRNSSSCTNVSTFFGKTSLTSGTLNYVPDDPNWNEATPCQCTISTPTPIHVSSSAIFTESCQQQKPADVGLFRGPLQGYLFAVRKASTERAITADEAYFVLGFGSMGQVTPWNDENFIHIRPVDASTLVCTAAAAGLDPAKAKGKSHDRSSQLLTAMTMVGAPDDKTIGMLGCAPYDRNRMANTVGALAFKAVGQKYAYYPDSTATSFDKRNMREGRYFPWSATDWFALVDGNGNILDDNARYLINLILDKPVTPDPGFDPLQVVMSAGLVPECAMRVTRSREAGDLSPYQSPTPCNCAFDAKFATSTCTACTDDTPCGGGKCRHGYCEPR
jgi:hypothetical protein